MTRAEILEAARKCVCGDREQDYGTPENSFSLIASLWSAYTGDAYTAKDVAMMLALLKVARIRNGDTADSFVDLAGYAACAGEIAATKAMAEEAAEAVKAMAEEAVEAAKSLMGAVPKLAPKTDTKPVHSPGCKDSDPGCLCNHCKYDNQNCCGDLHPDIDCPVTNCEYFEPEG